MPDTAPHVTVLQGPAGPVATAGNTATTVIGKATYAAKVLSVGYVVPTAVTGHASNNRTWTLINKKQDGAGTTAVATITSTVANAPAAFDEKALTLSATAANLVVAAGDVLAFESKANASGVEDPGGVVTVTLAAE